MTDPRPEHTPPAASTGFVASAPDGVSGAAATPEPTGHPTVDEVVASLEELEGKPVDQHVAVFESAHDRLREVLASGGAPTAPTA